ncbi:MAG TPA: putative sulfate exporter family transporter [Woeseiaceae bacterium]|nr:putative sulfate exporter family transporter [Woeseiaceae bacterium]
MQRVDLKLPGWWAGIGLAVLVSIVANYGAEWLGVDVLSFESSPISAIMVAIIIGMLIRNTLPVPQSWQTGLSFCATNILRLGIILLGIRLSLTGAGQFALLALPFVVCAIAVGLIAVGILGKTLGLSRQLAGLIAIGTSICGCTAIVAAAPLIKAHEAEVSYAVACVAVFGIIAMFFYPLLAHTFFTTQPELAGLFLGTSIHDTSQVAGAGMMYEAQYNAPVALDIATVTKLVRNLCMIAVIPLIGVLYGSERGANESGRINWLAIFPWFIIGFALMATLRSVGDMSDTPFGVLDPSDWHRIVGYIQHAAEYCLLVAMSAVGLTTVFAVIIGIGMRPFVLGLLAALLVGGASFTLIILFGETLLNALV